jgi:Cu-Zn family superoxide dismutase
MKNTIFISTAILIISCTPSKKQYAAEESNEVVTAAATLSAKSNSVLNGMASFVQDSGTVKLEISLTNAEPGTHAMHLHEYGDCESDDGSSAGGHWDPTAMNHGKWGHGEFHKGDIGNIEIDSLGNGTLKMTTDQWCLGCDDSTKNIIGTAIIIHTAKDDFITQPTGNAGVRIGCGVITKN